MTSRKYWPIRVFAFSIALIAGCAGDWVKAVQLALAAGPKAVEFFVSPHGNDSWSGRLASPGEKDGRFATIMRAREAVRTFRKAQAQPALVKVVLRGGTYYLDQPLDFGPADSGSKDATVIYAAAEGEKVVLEWRSPPQGRPLGRSEGPEGLGAGHSASEGRQMELPSTLRERGASTAHAAAEGGVLPRRGRARL